MPTRTCLDVRASLEDQLANLRASTDSDLAIMREQVDAARDRLKEVEAERDHALAQLAAHRNTCDCGAADAAPADNAPPQRHSPARIKHVCQ